MRLFFYFSHQASPDRLSVKLAGAMFVGFYELVLCLQHMGVMAYKALYSN